MKTIIFLLIACCSLLTGCSKRSDVEELTQRFFQHQDSYNQLAEVSCAVKAKLNTKFFSYNISTTTNYPVDLAPGFEKIDALLSQIDSNHIVFSESNCALFIETWSFWLSGEGAYIGYSYQPAKLSEYNPAIHLEKNRNFREKIHFTKPLSDGWYVEYANEP